ncbi:hypothetical protein CASFOL_031441 [Castilleja foliolosa]|uniref:Uncharacterized protein n=1 Tax=Castilleja foliolosa TaxID=1961234 RepID=A0ABD3C4Q8_9LAMI
MPTVESGNLFVFLEQTILAHHTYFSAITGELMMIMISCFQMFSNGIFRQTIIIITRVVEH